MLAACGQWGKGAGGGCPPYAQNKEALTFLVQKDNLLQKLHTQYYNLKGQDITNT